MTYNINTDIWIEAIVLLNYINYYVNRYSLVNVLWPKTKNLLNKVNLTFSTTPAPAEKTSQSSTFSCCQMHSWSVHSGLGSTGESLTQLLEYLRSLSTSGCRMVLDAPLSTSLSTLKCHHLHCFSCWRTLELGGMQNVVKALSLVICIFFFPYRLANQTARWLA